MPDVFANNASFVTTLSSGVSAPAQGASEAWTVATLSSVWPSLGPGQTMTVVDPAAPTEIIRLTASTGSGATSITVTRGADGTTPVTHSAGATYTDKVSAAALTAF